MRVETPGLVPRRAAGGRLSWHPMGLASRCRAVTAAARVALWASAWGGGGRWRQWVPWVTPSPVGLQVTEAVCRQLAVLNTNSRYLSAGLGSYCAELCACMPRPLEVAYLVCRYGRTTCAGGQEGRGLCEGVWARAHLPGETHRTRALAGGALAE